MAITPTAAFAQFPKTLTEEITGADDVSSETPANTVLIAQADSVNGGLLTSVTVTPKETVVSAVRVNLYTSLNGGTTKKFFMSALMAAHVVADTTEIPSTSFNLTEDAPRRLQAGEEIYAGAATALTGGMNAASQWSDF